jgi:activator of HSP90 ATPase
MAIHQEIVLSASPDRVYAVLTTGAQFSKATGGAPAEIASTEGGAFSQFGGAIHGRHIELVPAERVVQAWRTKMWEPGSYSLVRFTLAPDGKGTKVTLDHAGFPAEQEEHLAAGWHANYWEPFAKFFTAL